MLQYIRLSGLHSYSSKSSGLSPHNGLVGRARLGVQLQMRACVMLARRLCNLRGTF